MSGTTKDSKFLYNRRGDVVNTGTTFYVELPVENGTVGGQIAWLDATTAATITLELTSFGMALAAYDAAAAQFWKDSGVTGLSITAGAVGSNLINVENIRQKRARLKIVTTANSKIQVLAP